MARPDRSRFRLRVISVRGPNQSCSLEKVSLQSDSKCVKTSGSRETSRTRIIIIIIFMLVERLVDVARLLWNSWKENVYKQ